MSSWNSRIDQYPGGGGQMRSGILLPKHTGSHVCSIHQQKELVRERFRLRSPGLLCQGTKTRPNGLFMFDRNPVPRIIRVRVFSCNI